MSDKKETKTNEVAVATAYTITQKRVEELKAKHGEIYGFTLEDGRCCILKKPTLRTIDIVARNGESNPASGAGLAVKSSWVEGDVSILEDGGALISLYKKFNELIKIQEAEVEKL